MSEKRFKTKYYLKSRQAVVLGVVKVNEEENVLHWNEVVDLLNSQDEEIKELETKRKLLVQKKNRYFRLYNTTAAEVKARVDTLNKVCEYYLTEVQFKADTDPNEAVKEVINRILNTEVEM